MVGGTGPVSLYEMYYDALFFSIQTLVLMNKQSLSSGPLCPASSDLPRRFVKEKMSDLRADHARTSWDV